MDDTFAESEAEAREHIRQIRRQKGLGDDNEQIGHNAGDLQAALGVLSHDLYETTTHFLLELIQNADDNSYASDVTPTLSISYSPGKVRVDCNEKGFSKKNVETICRICKSTKSGESKAAGFVGEKGIGFKAVFKVAKTVWISSGHYSFCFERDGHLGMIAPIWGVFPGKKNPESGTSIILKLGDDCNEASIVDELNKYEPKILMFLRRLRRIEISVTQPIWKLGGDFKRSLSRVDKAASGQSQMVVLQKGRFKTNYLVWRHAVRSMPKDARRPGINDSEIVFGFPLDSDEETPVIENQDVYAFLPVTDIGLAFLLQGDFLLTANREQFHTDSSWNKALVKACSTAFVDAIIYMSRLDTQLRFRWLHYLPTPQVAGNLMWASFGKDVNSRLLKTDILLTRDGKYKKPKEVVHIPAAFRDRKGKPLIDTGGDCHLAESYKIDDQLTSITSLGVHYMNSWEFKKVISKELATLSKAKKFYANKDAQWHEDFCEAIIEGLSDSSGHEFKKLYIVPLPNGQWTRPDQPELFLIPNRHTKPREELLPLPLGLNITIVDELAMESLVRYRACVKSYVPTLSNWKIFDSIRETHRAVASGSAKFTSTQRSPEALVSQAVFLFRSEREDKHDWLFMACERGQIFREGEAYLQSDLPGSAHTVLLPESNSSFGFLHPLYKTAFLDEKIKWMDWLSETIPIYPRLISMDTAVSLKDANKTSNITLHRDFKSLLQNKAPILWLTVLRDGWDQYEEELEGCGVKFVALDSKSSPTASLVEFLRTYLVPCRGRRPSLPIKEAFQPTPRLLEWYDEDLAPLMVLPDPGHPNWRSVLGWLGIPGKETPSFFAECLRAARAAGDEIPIERINALMAQMVASRAVDPPVDRVMINRGYDGDTFFRLFRNPNDPLLCIPSAMERGESGLEKQRAVGGPKRIWVSSDHCYWSGESWLTGLHCLSDIYTGSEYEFFFRQQLKVTDITTKHLLRELDNVPGWHMHSTARIERLLLGLVHRHTTTEDKLDQKLIEEYKTKRCWPITVTSTNEPFNSWSDIATPWHIADRAFFREQFDGLLPVLAFDTDMVHRLMPLIGALGLKNRLLSFSASNIVEADGDVTLHEGLTEKYRSRTAYLVRLMPELQHDRDHVRDKFGNVEVYLASSIVQRWTAPIGVKHVESRASQGVAFLESDYTGNLRVYMKTGYDAEPFPIELADRLVEFFNIPPEKKDLVNVVLTANIDRLDEIFDCRGIPPVLEGIPIRSPEEYGDRRDVFSQAVSSSAEVNGKRSQIQLGTNQTSRFTRLLAHRRFGSFSSFKHTNGSVSSLPSYNAATGQSSGFEKRRSSIPIGKGTRPVPALHSLEHVEALLQEDKFRPQDEVVKAKLPEPHGILEKVKSFVQRDSDAAEMIVCDVLCKILNCPQEHIWVPRNLRSDRLAVIHCRDTHGLFGAFLQRLEGISGRGQGYNRFNYNIDVKHTEKCSRYHWHFTILQKELDRFRRYSIKSRTSEAKPVHSEVSVLAVVAEPRKDPKMLFVLDPWELYSAGQLQLKATSNGSYHAMMTLPGSEGNKGKGMAIAGESGFDAVQVREHEQPTWIPSPPPTVFDEKKRLKLALSTCDEKDEGGIDDPNTERSVSPL